MTYRQRLAEHLRHLLKLHGYGKQDVAFALGYQPSWTTKILNGDRPLSTDDIPRVAAFFGLTVDQFVAPGLSTLTDRRQFPRRKGERRKGTDRRYLDTRTWTPEDRRRAKAVGEDRRPPASATPEWTAAQRAAAAVKMKGDPLSDVPSRHGETFRSAGARQRHPAPEAQSPGQGRTRRTG